MKDKDKKVNFMDATETKPSEVETMNFTDWFSATLGESKKLKPVHYETVKAFFTNKNLTNNESKETFDDMLKVFGF